MVAPTFTTEQFPQSRLSTVDLGKIGLSRHYVAGLVEVDVTLARRAVRSANRGGDSPVSLLAWVMKCIADSLARHPEVHAVRVGKRRRAMFEHVNMSLMVERQIEGQRVPLPVLFHEVDLATTAEVEQRIAAARKQPVGTGSVTIGGSRRRLGMRIYYVLPGFLRRAILKAWIRRPGRLYRTMGSVVITSASMGARVRGWVIPRGLHPVVVAIGAVAQKAMVKNGAIVPREILHLTILVDHDVVDGAPAARWTADLVRIMERPRQPMLAV